MARTMSVVFKKSDYQYLKESSVRNSNAVRRSMMKIMEDIDTQEGLENLQSIVRRHKYEFDYVIKRAGITKSDLVRAILLNKVENTKLILKNNWVRV